MQTFLPYPDFDKSAAVLDRQRLGKQRLEVYQILRSLSGQSEGWKNHPAVQMWDGHVGCLATYGIVVCYEWLARGYRDALLAKIAQFTSVHDSPPWWLGDERLHSSHRARLLKKDPVWYGQFGWTESPSETNWWPQL